LRLQFSGVGRASRAESTISAQSAAFSTAAAAAADSVQQLEIGGRIRGIGFSARETINPQCADPRAARQD